MIAAHPIVVIIARGVAMSWMQVLFRAGHELRQTCSCHRPDAGGNPDDGHADTPVFGTHRGLGTTPGC